MGVPPAKLIKSARARADADPMAGQDTQTQSVDSMEDLLEAEGGAHPNPSDSAAEIAAEFGERLNADVAAAGGAVPPSPGQPIYPPGFDPKLHAWPPDKTARGTWRRKKASDPPAPMPINPDPAGWSANPTVEVTMSAQPPGASPADKAENWLGTWDSVGVMVLGETWRPTPTESVELRAKLTRFLELHNLPDLPPGLALLAVVCAYAVPRVLAIPRVQSFLRAHGLMADVPQVPPPIPSEAGGAD
jgi:hypothetical protein